jgi:hypothetical protein
LGKLQSPEDLRIGLVAYHDHPPQDHTYIVKNFGFSSNISKVQKDLSSLYASGGSDGPEAMTTAYCEAVFWGSWSYVTSGRCNPKSIIKQPLLTFYHSSELL